MSGEWTLVQWAAMLSAILFAGLAVFQILLFLGRPLGAYSWGGRHPGVLPPRLRRQSLPAAVVLALIGLVFLSHGDVVSIGLPFPATRVMMWIFTAFLALNTLGNLASASPQEKRTMAPISGVLCLIGLYIAIAA
ncbi:hypothetical protein [Cohnella sp. REN36]|uniref:hypothetical protein n=1 Tax=Cohnella sp. REN36 TaxID=2887347 RepID=UPI001D13A3EB|nr:hypothetical protein [Cohnella sp. REN36]MCC3377265.1 hypothetical protein [Cohnella sp. REN36]